MAKTKTQKRNEAKKNAEAMSAKKKAMRQSRAGGAIAAKGKKGRSGIPQAKKRK